MKTHKRMWNYIAAIMWTGVVILGSLTPGNELPKLSLFSLDNGDKIIHFMAYGVFVLLWSLALRMRGPSVGAARTAFYGSILLGLLIEICQGSLIAGRSFEIFDIIANIIGSIVGLVLFYKLF